MGVAAAPRATWVVAEPLTLSVMGSRSPLQSPWEELKLFRVLEAQTGIRLVFDTPIDDAYEERKNLAFASGSLPDVFFGGRLSPADEVTYGSQGLLLPLEALIAEHAPNLAQLLAERPDLRRAITTPDGHIYALPAVTAGFGVYPKLWINAAWLDALGLAMPRTTDELYEVLRAFQTGDPNGNGEADEIPISSTSLEGWPLDDLRPGLLAAFGFSVGYGRALFDVADGRVRFVPAEPAFYEYLAFVHRLYRDGLLDPDAFTQDLTALAAKGAADRLGAFTAAGPFLVVGPERNETFRQLLPLTSAVNATPMWPRTSAYVRGTFAISHTNPDPAATMRWVDRFYDLEGALLLVHGVYGEDWVYTPSGGIARLYPEGENPELYRAATLTPDAGSQLPHNREPVFALAQIDLAQTNPLNFYIAEQTALLEPYAAPTLPPLYFTPDEQRELSALLLELERFTQSAEAGFITGQRPLDTWEAYLETLRRIGLERVLALYTAAYERYLAAGAAE